MLTASSMASCKSAFVIGPVVNPPFPLAIEVLLLSRLRFDSIAEATMPWSRDNEKEENLPRNSLRLFKLVSLAIAPPPPHPIPQVFPFYPLFKFPKFVVPDDGYGINTLPETAG